MVDLIFFHNLKNIDFPSKTSSTLGILYNHSSLHLNGRSPRVTCGKLISVVKAHVLLVHYGVRDFGPA